VGGGLDIVSRLTLKEMGGPYGEMLSEIRHCVYLYL
jgi:hypothetical protein